MTFPPLLHHHSSRCNPSKACLFWVLWLDKVGPEGKPLDSITRYFFHSGSARLRVLLTGWDTQAWVSHVNQSCLQLRLPNTRQSQGKRGRWRFVWRRDLSLTFTWDFTSEWCCILNPSAVYFPVYLQMDYKWRFIGHTCMHICWMFEILLRFYLSFWWRQVNPEKYGFGDMKINCMWNQESNKQI